jgi:hypothetical protein
VSFIFLVIRAELSEGRFEFVQHHRVIRSCSRLLKHGEWTAYCMSYNLAFQLIYFCSASKEVIWFEVNVNAYEFV